LNEELKDAVLSPMAKSAPLRRVGTTSDIAWCVLYLASDASSFVTGQMISPNGGVAMSY
jgi:NAD(P)-dependent dehydrogenase (short-subunit alcohol dehydrogenase family)